MTRFLFFIFFVCAFVQGRSDLKIVDDPDAYEERIAHECGVALVRLRKPLNYYIEKYGDATWGTKKLLSLMEKQRNRGQDGAGLATVQFDMPSGQEYLQHIRSAADNAIESLFAHVMNDLNEIKESSLDAMDLKQRSAFVAEALLGHVRYATHSGTLLKFCQPFVRTHGIAARHFALAGNFNMTNTSDLFRQLEDWGLSPTSQSDTQMVLYMIAHYLDQEYKRIFNDISPRPSLEAGRNLSESIAQQIDLTRVLSEAAQQWDGGYVFCAILGNGDAFICRDPAGIRPGYYYIDDEVIAAASERVALMDVFDVSAEQIQSIKPGHVIVIKRSGEIAENAFAPALKERHCTFERIYFSKSHDPEIYEERKALGRQLAPAVFEALGGDLTHAIFTYAPNSSLSAFQGLIEGITQLSREMIKEEIQKLGILDFEQIQKLMDVHVRTEYLITKNQKLRTFISSEGKRKSLVSELYEVTQGVVKEEDVLIVIDDSIVRGTTLKESLIKKLIKLNPKKILILSSAPPILYPDCYGIDMSQLGRFIAFKAAVALCKEQGHSELIEEIHRTCLAQRELPVSQLRNCIKSLYDRCDTRQLCDKIAQLITPEDSDWKGSVQILYQTLDGLHQAIPMRGDWYFSGEYPTPGGYKVLNNSFIKWHDGDDSRSY